MGVAARDSDPRLPVVVVGRRLVLPSSHAASLVLLEVEVEEVHAEQEHRRSLQAQEGFDDEQHIFEDQSQQEEAAPRLAVAVGIVDVFLIHVVDDVVFFAISGLGFFDGVQV